MNTKNDNLIHYDHESRIVRLEVTIENINETLKRMDKRFDNIDSKLNSIDAEIRSDFKWTIKTMIGLVAVAVGIMTHGFHWF